MVREIHHPFLFFAKVSPGLTPIQSQGDTQRVEFIMAVELKNAVHQ